MKPDPRRAVQAVALLAALAVGWAVASTDGSSARPPVAWVPALAVLALLARTALWQRAPAWADACLALLLGIAAGHRLLLPGFPVGHDTTTHLWGSYAFFRAIDAGSLYPAWAHELGPGIPLPLFYPPVSFYLELPFRAAGLPVYDCLKFAFLLFRALAGLAMWLAVRRWTGRSDAGLVAAGAYVFAPYHLLDAHYRAALAESAALAVLPVFFLAVGGIARAPGWQSIRRGAWATALLALTHPLGLAMGSVAGALWIAARARLRPSREALVCLGALGAALGLGTAVAGFYTLPVMLESGSTSVGAALYADDGSTSYSRYGLAPADLLTRRPWDRLRTLYPHDVEPPETPMPFYFGWAWLGCVALAAAGAWLARREGDEPQPWRGLPSVAALTLLFCLHPLSVWLGALPVLPVLQFPWRFLAIATFAASALAGPALLALTSVFRAPAFARVAPALLLALFVADAWPGLGAPAWRTPYSGIPRAEEWQRSGLPLPLRVDRLRYPPADPEIALSLYRRAYAEYQTPEAYAAYSRATRATLERMSVSVAFSGWTGPPIRLAPEPYAAFEPAGGGAAEELAFERGGGRISVLLPKETGRLVVKEQWFPGWRARIDGRDAAIEPTPDGLMGLRVPAGAERLELAFSRLHGARLAGWIVSALALVALALPAPGRK